MVTLIILYIVFTVFLYNFNKEASIDLVEKVIYNRDFKDFLSEEDFIDFIRIGTKRTITKAKEILAVQNTKFDKLYYFAVIPKYQRVTLKSNDTIFSYLKEGAWIGIIEFILNYLDNNDKTWLINLSCESSSDVIIVYEFDKYELKKFLIDGRVNVINSMLLIWMKYLIISVSRINIHLAEAYKSFEALPSNRFAKRQSEDNEPDIILIPDNNSASNKNNSEFDYNKSISNENEVEVKSTSKKISKTSGSVNLETPKFICRDLLSDERERLVERTLSDKKLTPKFNFMEDATKPLLDK